ncbi:histone deacetylase family protein [Kordiimonas aquimaris]|uniref:histone deacetylase family protein n=1 Tax=Kordiimonas aquimaris TaxID=707591 RepID=UPI0021D20171|nr:histone deacetylase family protein [Kordiimonas aquimaris]
MKIFYSDKHAAHDCAGEIKDGELKPCFENPSRADAIDQAFKQNGFDTLYTPSDFGLEPVLKVHDADYIEFLHTAWQEWQAIGRKGDIFPLVWPGAGMRREVQPENIDGKLGIYAFDSGTPICAGTWGVVYQGAQAAISTADAVMRKQTQHAFSFSRPPGHHAMPGQYGGYCFLNNAAIAAQYMRDNGAKKVAVLDVDYHHGNGTQAIFYNRADVLVVNVHSDPKHEYPYYLGHADEVGDGAGNGFNVNLPLPKGTGWDKYLPTLNKALHSLEQFAPDALVVSFGADTYKDDPLGFFKLDTNHFIEIGAAIAKLEIPTATILEGGYAIEALGDNVIAMINGLSAK